jgi:hypothetical protein
MLYSSSAAVGLAVASSVFCVFGGFDPRHPAVSILFVFISVMEKAAQPTLKPMTSSDDTDASRAADFVECEL